MLLNLCSQSSHITLFCSLLNLQTRYHVQPSSRIPKSKTISWGWQAGFPSGFGVGKGLFLQNGSPVRFARLRSLAVDLKGNNYLKVSFSFSPFSAGQRGFPRRVMEPKFAAWGVIGHRSVMRDLLFLQRVTGDFPLKFQWLKELCHEIQPNWEITKWLLN